jgi:cyclopropane fatty-acyl-phospholipid synthase-like methyltransferase
MVLVALVSALPGCGRPAAASRDSNPRAGTPRSSPVADRQAAQYDAYRRPQQIVDGLRLAPGMRVADVGAGRGFLTARIAAAVAPGGHVVATDIDGEAIAAIPRSPAVETRRVTADDPGLEAGAYDRILVAEVDHYLADRAAWLAKLRRALKPDGFIAVENRLFYRTPLLAAAGAAGLRAEDITPAPPAHFYVRLGP